MNLTQKLKPSYWEDMESQLKTIFYQIVFQPVIEIISKANAQMKGEGMLNANDEPLREGLRSGRVQYVDGLFSGRFNAAIGRALRSIGASFNKRTGTYSLNAAKVPAWIKAEAGVYKTIARSTNEAIKKALGYTQGALDQLVDKFSVRPQKTLARFEQDFIPIAKALEVHPTLTTASKVKLSAEYRDNMKLWIRKFSEESIRDLRDTVEANANEGYRFDRLIDSIEQRYSVSQSKAKFLARQETALFMSKFRKNRFNEAGVRMYRWSTSHDERVRPEASLTPAQRLHAGNHRVLQGQVFSYEQKAPAHYMSSGKPCNPGEDYNCRCIDIPILGSIAEAA